MLRGLAVLFAVAACGRVAFDTNVDAAGADDAVSDGDGDGTTPAGVTIYLISSDGIDTELFTVDPPTGQLALVGSFSGLGTTGGLAYWDANTLYATANNSLIRITLAPFSAAMVSTMQGTWAAIERDGAKLFGVDQDSDSYGSFDPANAGAPVATLPMGFTATGSDVAFDGTDWYYFANDSSQLYLMNAAPAAVGSPNNGAPFMSGLVADETGNLWVHSGDADAIYSVDKVTGQLGPAITLCLECPTPYDMQSGDMSRSP